MCRCTVADVNDPDVSLKQLGHDGHDHPELVLNAVAIPDDHGVLIAVGEADALLVGKIHAPDLRVQPALLKLIQHLRYEIDDRGVAVVGLERLSSAERLPTSGSEPAPWPRVIFSPI